MLHVCRRRLLKTMWNTHSFYLLIDMMNLDLDCNYKNRNDYKRSSPSILSEHIAKSAMSGKVSLYDRFGEIRDRVYAMSFSISI